MQKSVIVTWGFYTHPRQQWARYTRFWILFDFENTRCRPTDKLFLAFEVSCLTPNKEFSPVAVSYLSPKIRVTPAVLFLSRRSRSRLDVLVPRGNPLKRHLSGKLQSKRWTNFCAAFCQLNLAECGDDTDVQMKSLSHCFLAHVDVRADLLASSPPAIFRDYGTAVEVVVWSLESVGVETCLTSETSVRVIGHFPKAVYTKPENDPIYSLPICQSSICIPSSSK